MRTSATVRTIPIRSDVLQHNVREAPRLFCLNNILGHWPGVTCNRGQVFNAQTDSNCRKEFRHEQWLDSTQQLRWNPIWGDPTIYKHGRSVR